MVTFYITTRYWESDVSEITDVSRMSEDELLKLISNDPNALIKVEPHVSDSAFRHLFLVCSPEGYANEGVFHVNIKGRDILYRIIENINCVISREAKKDGKGSC